MLDVYLYWYLYYLFSENTVLYLCIMLLQLDDLFSDWIRWVDMSTDLYDFGR